MSGGLWAGPFLAVLNPFANSSSAFERSNDYDRLPQLIAILPRTLDRQGSVMRRKSRQKRRF